MSHHFDHTSRATGEQDEEVICKTAIEMVANTANRNRDGSLMRRSLLLKPEQVLELDASIKALREEIHSLRVGRRTKAQSEEVPTERQRIENGMPE
jgi:hypothetical protein